MAREGLPDEPGRMELFQTLRLLERRAREAGKAAPLGEASGVAAEPVRISVRPGTAFAPGEVAAFAPAEPADPEAATPARPARLRITPIGLTGASGALPQAYSDLVSAQLRAHDRAFSDFLALFDHRVATLFYRAWAKYRPAVAWERADEGADDPITALLYAVVGLGQPALRGRAPVPDAVVLHYGGLFARRVRHADGLAALLGDHFGRQIRVEQFAGRWLRLAEPEFTRLGAAHASLGRDAVAGPKIWDVQGNFRLSVGPLSYSEFEDFMPEGAALASLSALARFYAGPGLGFDVEVVLARAEVPRLCLGAGPGPAARLGWNTWLASEPPLEDPRDAVFRPPDTEGARP